MKIKVTVNTGFVGATHVDYYELPCNWDSLSQDKKENYMEELAKECMEEYIEDDEE